MDANQLPDMSWHIGFVKKDEWDPHRHKARCIYSSLKHLPVELPNEQSRPPVQPGPLRATRHHTHITEPELLGQHVNPQILINAYYQEPLGVTSLIAPPQIRPEDNYFVERPKKSASLRLDKGA